MSISAKSLFHFCNEIDKLKGILENRFYPAYCSEEFKLEGADVFIAVPMVSFCDIPLSEVKDHIDTYGSYGVGMKKEWGIMNKLNPVFYIEKNSGMSGNLVQLGESLTKKDKSPDKSKSLLHYCDIYRNIKNYQNDLERNGTIYNDYVFYNEREWRYLIPIEKTDQGITLEKEKYLKHRGTSKNKPLLKEHVLNFKANDIKYIIVDNEKDIPKIIRTIQECNNLGNTFREIEILISKIITVEQIRDDF